MPLHIIPSHSVTEMIQAVAGSLSHNHLGVQMRFETKKTRAAVAQALGVGIAGVLLSMPAASQQAPREKIEVTGSNIKRVDQEGPAPVQVITREQIERSGSSTVAEVLRNLPANSAGSYDDTFTGSFARGWLAGSSACCSSTPLTRAARGSICSSRSQT